MSKQERLVLGNQRGVKFWCRDDYTLNSPDMSIASAFLNRGEYANEVFSLPKGGVVLDLGAHIGIFSLLVKHVRPDLDVYAVEPSLENVELLRRNILENKTNITVLPYAVGVSSGRQRMWVHRFNHGANTMVREEMMRYPDEYSGETEVDCLTFPELVMHMDVKRIDFCKMDIQGMEYELLEWLLKNPETFNMIKAMEIEFHPLRNNYDEAYRLLDKLDEAGFTGDQINRDKVYVYRCA